VILHLTVLIQYRGVTDGQIDARTRDDSIYCASVASRGNNNINVNVNVNIFLVMFNIDSNVCAALSS